MENCFITGSYAYGKPHADSDIDLVVFVDYDTKNILKRLALEDNGKLLLQTTEDPVRFGKLNLILIHNQDSFEIWKSGTEELTARSKWGTNPIDKETAKVYFNELREEAGIDDDYM